MQRAKNAMDAFRKSSLMINLRREIEKKKKLARQQEEAEKKKANGALDALFSQTNKGDDANLFKAPKSRMKKGNAADMLKLSMNKKPDLTQI